MAIIWFRRRRKQGLGFCSATLRAMNGYKPGPLPVPKYNGSQGFLIVFNGVY